jgi:allantoin racemase
MKRVLVLVPHAFDEEGLANRQAQQDAIDLADRLSFDYRPVKAGPDLFDSHHDWLLGELAIFEAGLSAQEDGYDAVCIDTVSDSGMNALRSVLDIPVIGAGKASFLAALLLGTRFSILTQWDPWIGMYKKSLREYGLEQLCASIRSINAPPDLQHLHQGKEDVLFPQLLEAGLRCVEEDGADVICLGSISMHQSYAFLAANLPVPVINPGPLAYKQAETVLALGLTHSRKAYASPRAPKHELTHAMLAAGAGVAAQH